MQNCGGEKSLFWDKIVNRMSMEGLLKTRTNLVEGQCTHYYWEDFQ